MARTRTRSTNGPADQEENAPVVSDSRRRRRGAADDAATESTRRERTVSTRQPAKPRGQAQQGLVYRIPVVRSIAGYLHGVRTELQKVTWPTRDETLRLTGVVLAVTAISSIALGLLSTFLSWWFQQAFHPDSEPTFLIVAAAVAVVVGGTYTVFRSRV